MHARLLIMVFNAVYGIALDLSAEHNIKYIVDLYSRAVPIKNRFMEFI